MWRALGLAWELGYIIALPLILLLLLGRWIDQHFGTQPWATLGGILLALLTTGYWMAQKMSTFREKL